MPFDGLSQAALRQAQDDNKKTKTPQFPEAFLY
jgi:hypothetical protein